jgi:hypothetical protein
MSRIERRVERAEQALSVGQEPLTVNVVWFGGEPVPPEERRGIITVRYVAYESTRKRLEGANE